jgi:hypothetical protein
MRNQNRLIIEERNIRRTLLQKYAQRITNKNAVNDKLVSVILRQLKEHEMEHQQYRHYHYYNYA